MLLDRKEEVQAAIMRLADAPEIATIRVYDKHGFIVMSAVKKEIGQRIELDSETCRSCHPDEAAKIAPCSNAGRWPASAADARCSAICRSSATSRAAPTAACHAHPTTERVLGVLDLEMSMAPLDGGHRGGAEAVPLGRP